MGMIYTNDDTIAAIATAATDAGIGIIRVSGTNAIKLVNRFYMNGHHVYDLEEHQAGTIKFGYIVDPNSGNVIDEVMVSVMKAPHSYTREDVVEINTHGGTMVMQQILHMLIADESLCRLAEPGEFTKRAFLNGRIDLTRAEAVMDIIEAKSEFALRNSEKQLRGSMRDLVVSMRADILYEMAYIESALDDPENYDLTGFSDSLSSKVSELTDKCTKLINSSDEGRLRTQGLNVVIIGKPNSGKSSLLNILTGEDTAIVTDIAGTTRDVIEHDVKFGDLLMHVIDTAGIRESDDMIEQIGVDRARKFASDADLILYVVDATDQFDHESSQIFASVKNKKMIVLLNKSDKENDIVIETKDIRKELIDILGSIDENEKEKADDVRTHAYSIPVIETSMKSGSGIEDLKKSISDLFFDGQLVPQDELYVTNIRHKQCLEKALNSLNLVIKSIDSGLSEDFFSVDLQDAYYSLGEIIGEEVGDDLVNEIFSKFCMGK